MPTSDQSINWYHSDSGVTPDAITKAWVKTGSAGVVTLIDGEGVELNDNSASSVLTFHQQAHPADNAAGRIRKTDHMEIQASVKGVSYSSSWASAVSPIVIWIDDGIRSLGLSIGDELSLVNPNNGDIYATVRNSHPWLTHQHYRLIKYGSGRWELQVNGETIHRLPYRFSGASAGLPARMGFGSMDNNGTARAIFEGVECGLNRALPPQWKVDRYVNSLPLSIQTRWTEEGRALLRSMLGVVQTPIQMMRELWQEMTADRIAVEAFAFLGDLSPEDLDPAWALVPSSSPFSIVRERVRFDGGGTASEAIDASFAAVAGGTPADAEHTGGVAMTVRSYTVGPNGRIGPHLQMQASGYTITAQLWEDAGVAYWTLTDAALSGAVAPVDATAINWPVNVLREVDVELQVFGGDVVLLLVDGQIVDRQPISIFPASASEKFRIGVYGAGGASPLCVFDLRNGRAERRMSDLTRRPLLEQSAQERQIFVAGCERNDELDTWSRHHHEVHALRGTTVGIIVEMRRLGCHADQWVTPDIQPAGWFLEASYPEVTPIYLELAGEMVVVFVEFSFDAPNFTAQQLADLAARYLVPMSTEDLRYEIAVASMLTAGATLVGGFTRLVVKDTSHFAAGDTVTLRSPDNAVNEVVVVNGVSSSTVMTVTSIPVLTPYITGSVVRKTLATT